MRSNTSLRDQVMLLTGGCAGLILCGSVLISRSESFGVRVLGGGLLAAAAALLAVNAMITGRAVRSINALRSRTTRLISGDFSAASSAPAPSRELADLHASFGRMIDQLRVARAEHERSQQELAGRTHAMDRLLEFSQTIQGAGRVDQIFATLCHFVETELGLSGVAILAHDAEPGPGIQLKACSPEGLLNGPVTEFETALCPCLRQSQPRLFRADGSPVRCTIEQYLKEPAGREAYCVPFNVGRKMQLVLHMILPPGQTWSEQRRQLAQTYANTAQSSLASLHLLSEAEKQSMTDGLTALYNRRSLDQLLEREVALAERHHQPLSLVMIDMDFFKQVNDSHGHAAGDHLLRAFADCVRITLRKTDLAFRYGGDEFVIALPQTPIAQAQQVVQKLRQAFASVDFSSAIAHLDQQPTLSIGLAERSATTNVLTLAALLTAADQALYEAKTANRNCVRTYQPPRAA